MPELSALPIRTVDSLRGPAGRLEALYNPGSPGANHAVVLCHPHPLYGGTMHNKVVYHAMKVFQAAGLPVLRFNFRGAGLSEGTHDDGRGEPDDVRAALDWLAQETALPLIGAGFSFGAHMVFQAGCADRRVKGLVGLGLPIAAGGRSYHYDFLAACPVPKLVVIGGNDAFAPRDQVEAALAPAHDLELNWVPDADHFFAGHLPLMQHALRTWLHKYFVAAPVSPRQACPSVPETAS